MIAFVVATLVATALAKTVNVQLKGDVVPPVTRIDVGDCVSWLNNGRGVHALQAADGSFDSGFLLVGDSYQQCFFGVARVVQYYDALLPDQTALVVVGDVPFVAPTRTEPAPPTTATPKPEFTPVTKPATQPPVDVQLTASAVRVPATAVSNLNEISSDSIDTVVVEADFVGAESASVRAVLSDGCNTLYSLRADAAPDATVQFAPLDARSLKRGALSLGVEIAQQIVPGGIVLNVAAEPSGKAPAPRIQSATIAWSALSKQ